MTTSGFVSIPVANTIRLRRARVPAALCGVTLPAEPDHEGLVGADIEISGGSISALAPAGTFEIEGAVDLDFGQVWPCLIDVHTHLDISHIWPRTPNRDGTFPGAMAATDVDLARRWSANDIYRRMDFGLRCSYARGTAAVRTHVVSNAPWHTENAWSAFRELRDRWAGRIELQATSQLYAQEIVSDLGTQVANMAAANGANLGAVVHWNAKDYAESADLIQATLDDLFEQAETRGLDLDLHVDEMGDSGARSLIQIARTAIRRRFKGRILCGHCCSLAQQPDDLIHETLAACSDAGIAIVSLPMCNMYLQDRLPGRTPRWRGVTLLQEMQAHGIPVSVASDDVRNPWFAFGDHDMMEVFTQAVRIAHLDYPYGFWPRAATSTPASVMGLDGLGTIGPGAPADLVLFRARSMNELVARSQSDRVVMRRGRAIDRALPDYRELDDLQVRPNSAVGSN